MGGTSTERDVSLSSGAFVAHGLRQRGYAVAEVRIPEDLARARAGELPVYGGAGSDAGGVVSVNPDPPTLDELRAMERDLGGQGLVLGLLAACAEADVVFPALHGGLGEDGTLQAVLETAGIPHTGAHSQACAVAFNKAVAKPLLRDAGIPTPAWQVVGPGDPVPDRSGDGGLPAVVKPAKGGSTLGVQLVRSQDELAAAVEATRRFGDEVLVEEYAEGLELTVGVVGDRALPVVEIVYDGPIFEYVAKYQPGSAREICPARIPDEVRDQVQEAALRVHRTLRLGPRAYSRVDFKVAPGGTPLCLEANVLPGMTPFSLIKRAADAAELPFPDLCARIVEMARERGA
jgi:D-alanine-D-alanine ligase